MAEAGATKRLAVVTGGNKGIGYEVCRQLASNGVLVVLTARDEKRGTEAVESLKACGLSDVVFHQLDVTDPLSVASLADFVKTRFGKLDILVNNAGISGSTPTVPDAFDKEKLPEEASKYIVFFFSFDLGHGEYAGQRLVYMMQSISGTYESSKECLDTNYYGTKRVTEALLPLLELSNSARIVNVSSSAGLLQGIGHKKAMEVLDNIAEDTEQKLDELLNDFLEDYKEGSPEAKGWPHRSLGAYMLSKAAMNSYTRVLAKKFPSIRINCVCPGYVKTDINFSTGLLTVEEGAESVVRLALLPHDGPTDQLLHTSESFPRCFNLSMEVAKCNAILLAVQNCGDHLGIEKMYSDATLVIDAIISPVLINCNLDPIIFDIRNLIKDRGPLDFNYISRIHNVQADILAESALSKSTELYLG
ncbi:hypothetical protein Sjap_005000 [Stephania japonica]|uniref:Uncharacterized protein n=1 Tax=Stephania japonica TaxID=461633 RepID=A0AAP0K5I2_9MAGN